ncbi:atrophin-1-like [Colossoma macropomum]|uniref:atrophin-1-like n=1 Tax=Colossoma macropomum TaxID=42526 RepID=UPI001864EC31|nr:atrophin-1-like [Colossoma macropomum]
MAWCNKRLWILVTTLCVLRDASGYGVWSKGPFQDQGSADVSAPLPQFPKPGLSSDGSYFSRTLTDGGSPRVVSAQTSTSSSLTTDSSQDSGLSQPVELRSQVPSSVAVPASGFVGNYQPVFQSERLGGPAPQSQLPSSSTGFRQSVLGAPQQGAFQQGSFGSPQSVPSVQGFSRQSVGTRMQTTSRNDALTPPQQGGFWAQSSGQSGRPQPANVGPSPFQPQRLSDQLAYASSAGQGSKPLSPPQNLGGGLTSSSQGSYGATYSSASWYNPQAVSQSRPGPLTQLKARLFTSQGAPVTSSSVRPASDLPQRTGSPYLTVPSQGATTWQAPSSFQPGFQSAPSQVQSAPSGQYGALVSRFEQYSPASQTSRAYELSRGLSSTYSGVQSPPGFTQPGSVVGFMQPQQTPVAEVASGGSSAPLSPSFYSGSPSLSSTGDAYSAGLSDVSYFRPASQRVSAQRDSSVKG